MAAASDDRADTLRDFKAAVNMAPAGAGEMAGDGRIACRRHHAWRRHGVRGHHSGRRIVELLKKHQADLSDADLAHMREDVGDVRRHLAQRPAGDVRWAPPADWCWA